MSGLYQSHKEAIHKLFRVLINLMWESAHRWTKQLWKSLRCDLQATALSFFIVCDKFLYFYVWKWPYGILVVVSYVFVSYLSKQVYTLVEALHKKIIAVCMFLFIEHCLIDGIIIMFRYIEHCLIDGIVQPLSGIGIRTKFLMHRHFFQSFHIVLGWNGGFDIR